MFWKIYNAIIIRREKYYNFGKEKSSSVFYNNKYIK